MLLNLEQKEIFVYGDLKQWKRKDRYLFIKDNLAEKTSRRKDWNKKHKKNKIYYTNEECRKAKCIHYKRCECEFLITPDNNKKSIKLKNATGFCFDYTSFNLENIYEKIDNFVKLTFLQTSQYVQKKIKIIEQIKIDLTKKNIASNHFNQKFFSVYISFLKFLTRNKKSDIVLSKNSFLEQINDDYSELTHLARDFFFRSTSDKPIIKAKQNFESLRDDLIEKMLEKKRELNSYIKKLKIFNRLKKNLFKGFKHKIGLFYEELQEGFYIYFINSSKKESLFLHKKISYTNIGRVFETQTEKWVDTDLTRSRFISLRSDISRISNYPIFKVLKTKKSYIEIENIESKEINRLIHNRKYKCNLLIFQDKYFPDLRVSQKIFGGFNVI